MDSEKDSVKRWPLDGERTAWKSEKCGSCWEFRCEDYKGEKNATGCRQAEGRRGPFSLRHKFNDACQNWRPVVTLASYQEDIGRTVLGGLGAADRITEAAIGAASEAGEVAGLIKKWRYQGHELDRRKIIEESGDTLYYLARGLQEIGSSLEDAMCINVLKRKEIYPNGFDPERSKGRG